MAIFNESLHPRRRGKFGTKPLSPGDAKLHAVTPVKKAAIHTGATQVGALNRRKDQKAKMNTGKKSRNRDV
jgi:hypothetical protein